MPKYSVYFVIRDWIETEVQADSEEEAKEKAERRVNKLYDNSKIQCIDGSTEYSGFTNISLTNKIFNRR